MKEVNSNIESYETIENNINKLVNIYDSNEEMQKNKELSKNMEIAIEENYYVKDLIAEFNSDADAFNGSKKLFSANIMSIAKGWKNVNNVEVN